MEQENFSSEQETEVLSVDEEINEEVVSVESEAVTETETVEEVSPEEEIISEKKSKKGPAMWQMIVAGVVSALLLVALALLLLYGLGFEIAPKADAPAEEALSNTETQPTEQTPAFVPKKVYVGTQEEFDAAGNAVVATINGKELTNNKLQVYYSVVVNEFLTNYYSYLGTIGLDYTKPYSEQKCYFDENISWEEYFVNAAVETWVNYQSVALLAEEANFELPADVKEVLDNMIPELEKQAEEMKYESVEAMVKEHMNCSVEEYVEYWTMYQIGASFTNQEPAKEVVEKYYSDNLETFESSGITKDSGPIVDVRHILITPEGGETDENGVTTYPDSAWTACKEKAEQILKEWKDGEATEESFAALANEKSADGGSSSNGGLYEGVTKDTSFVEPFLTWCMDEKNKVGSTGIVKTEFGYHIMYLSATEPYWYYEAVSAYLTDNTMKLIETGKEKWPAQIDMDKICLLEVKIA